MVALQDREQVGVVPSPVPPDLLPGDPFVAVSAFLVHPAHRGVDRVPLDPVQAQLLEGEASPHPDRVAGVAPAPGVPLADHESADGGSGAPLNLVERDEADVRAVLGEDRPVQVVLALGLDALEEGFLLATGDPQD